MLKDRILDIFFPAKCLLCQRVLSRDETDLCHNCRKDTEEYPKPKHKISFVAGWTSMWYYSDTVRKSLLLYNCTCPKPEKPYATAFPLRLYRKPWNVITIGSSGASQEQLKNPVRSL